MARRLSGTVVLRDPATGLPVVIGPADTVPEWAASLITNPGAWAGDSEAADEADEASIPRPDGRAGRDTWAEYAQSIGLEIDDDATKADIKAAVDAAQR